jgi:hypothetical protein
MPEDETMTPSPCWPYSTIEASARLTECGLAYAYVDAMIPGLSWDVRLGPGSDLTYDTLRRVADRFGTTDLRVRHVDEVVWSEVTIEGSEMWLEIRDPKVMP